MIHFRRIKYDMRNPFMSAMIAWEKAEGDNLYYFAGEQFSREFLRESISKHGIAAVRRFFKSLKAELAERVASRQTPIVHAADVIEYQNTPRSYERWCEMLGVEPEVRAS